jgi:Spy/CpxP family protein refolding chaperone
MFLKSRLIVAGLLGLLLMTSSAPASSAQQPEAPGADMQRQQNERGMRRGRRQRGGGERHLLRLLREMELTDAQQQQARTILENHLATIKPLREELFKLREQREQGAESADLHSRAQALRSQLQESTQNMRTQLLAILTPDQRTKLDQMEAEFKGRRERMRERHRGMRDRTDEQDQQQ